MKKKKVIDFQRAYLINFAKQNAKQYLMPLEVMQDILIELFELGYNPILPLDRDFVDASLNIKALEYHTGKGMG